MIRSTGALAFSMPVTIGAASAAARNVATSLASELRRLGIPSIVGEPGGAPATIWLADGARSPRLGEEGYRLDVGRLRVTIVANTAAGLFYGAQTLEQLVLAHGRSDAAIPRVHVVDWPQYRWRGVHLDVSRHFFPVKIVERYIDLAARYKLNTFHWHLTDDQGWRIEIRSYPRLTAVGGCRDGTQVGAYGSTATDGIRTCGFYSQDQIREVVAYAKARYVAVIPEIEGPGHSIEALAAYPFLACAPGAFTTLTLWGSSKYSVCPTEPAFKFYDGVLREIAHLFPARVIHIGGDEVPYFSWRRSADVDALMRRRHLGSYAAVGGYFTRRIEAIARKYGRRIAGWDEIDRAGVSRDAIVMAWTGTAAGAAAVQHGNDVVMTPDPPLYFDAYQGPAQHEPPAIGGLTTLQTVYAYDPMPSLLGPGERAHVLGAQANLWTEYIPTASQLWYMAYPRTLALAELCWTPRALMSWDDFARRLGPALLRLEAMRIPFRIPEVRFRVEAPIGRRAAPRAVDRSVVLHGRSEATVRLEELAPDATIRYTMDGTLPTSGSRVYKRPLRLRLKDASLRVSAIALLADHRASAPASLDLVRR